MNSRYDIRIRNFSSLGTEDVVCATFNEDGRPSFRLSLYPHRKPDGGLDKYVSVLVSRYWYYPRWIPGLVDDTVSFTVSVVDIEGKERFPTSFAKDDLFSLQWMENLLGSDDFRAERFLKRETLLDQAGELLPDDVLTVRVDVSCLASGPHVREDVGEYTRSIDCPSASNIVPERGLSQLRCLESMEESLHELREFFKLYADLQRLHEVLGDHPDLEPMGHQQSVDALDALFPKLSECFDLRRIRQREATAILPYSEHMDEDQLKVLQRRLWKNRDDYHRENTEVGSILEAILEPSSKPRRTVLDEEVEWYKHLHLVERRVQLLLRLFSLSQKLKHTYSNRSWWDRDKEDEWTNERRNWGDRQPKLCLEENIQEMFDLYDAVRGGQRQEEGLLKNASRFFTLFVNTLEILADFVFRISEVFLDWTQSVIEKTLSRSETKRKTKTKQKGSIVDGPLLSDDSARCQQDGGSGVWNFIIETEDGESHVVPFQEGSITLGSKLLAASPVFERMLSNPMKESLEKRLKMSHFDSATVTDFLSYVATNKLREDINLEDCLALYDLAHMYQVQGLLEASADHLYQMLCSQNVVQVRKLSRRWGDDHPMNGALDRFYEDLFGLEDPTRSDRTFQEPEFKSTLKEWARSQRARYDEGEDKFNFYQ